MVWTTPKTFTAGERLFAQDLNTYVSDNLSDLDPRTVKSFADASARSTAIPSPTEGAVTYLQDTDAVEVYDGSAWAAVGSDPNPGIGSNSVQATKTNTQLITSTSLVDVTGLSVTITPSSATSKVLIIARVNYALTPSERAAFSLLRGATEVFIADAASSRGRATHAGMSLGSDNMEDITMVYLDSPASAAATTYKVQAANSASSLFINRTGTDSNSSTWWRGTSSLLVVEVAA